MHSRLDPVAAREILEAASPCPDGTCVANNEIRADYDLQIIIPAYNAECYIEECLNSVMEQETSYRCLATVVNDGSTDRTAEILAGYMQKMGGRAAITLEVISQENRGFSGARNAALKCIRGEYVIFLDSDDVLPPGAIQHMMDMASKTDAEVVEGGMYDFVTGSKPYEIRVPSTVGLLADNRYVFSGYPCGKLYRSVVLAHFCFPEGFWFEDTPILFILAAMPWRCAATQELVYGYRKNPSGISSTAWRSVKSIDSYWITERCLEEFPAFKVAYDQRAYEYLLRQSAMNWRRTRHQSRKVREAIFVLTAQLCDQYFADARTEVADMRAIEDAIRRRQFVRYELLMTGR